MKVRTYERDWRVYDEQMARTIKAIRDNGYRGAIYRHAKNEMEDVRMGTGTNRVGKRTKAICKRRRLREIRREMKSGEIRRSMK